MARQGRRDDSRSRSRGRTRNYRGRSRSRPSQHQHQRRQDSLELPRSWKSTPTEYDSNREYGLNLPRQVVSNRFTRDLRIDGMDIFDVRLAQVMTGGLNNWGLRSLANGRHTVWESFKSRQEAITAGTLMRSLRGDNSSRGTARPLRISPCCSKFKSARAGAQSPAPRTSGHTPIVGTRGSRLRPGTRTRT